MPSADDRIDAVGVELENLPNYVAEGIARQSGASLREARDLAEALLALDGEDVDGGDVEIGEAATDGGRLAEVHHEHRVETISRHDLADEATEEALREWSEEGFEVVEASLVSGDVVFFLRRSALADGEDGEGAEIASDGGRVVHEHKVITDGMMDLLGRSSSGPLLTGRYSGSEWELRHVLDTGSAKSIILRRPARDVHRG